MNDLKMEKLPMTIEVRKDLVEEISSLQYEIEARKYIITEMIRHPERLKGEQFKAYRAEFNRYLMLYDRAKTTLEEEYVLKVAPVISKTWKLEFESNTVIISDANKPVIQSPVIKSEYPKIIAVSEADSNYIESLQYTKEGNKETIMKLLETETAINSDEFVTYHNEYRESFVIHDLATQEISKKYVTCDGLQLNRTWKLDFRKKSMVVTLD
jgi:hypothetical protein